MFAEVDISPLLKLSFDEQVSYVRKNMSDVTGHRSIYELTMANKSLLTVDDIRNRILPNPYHNFSDVREITELYSDIDINTLRFQLSTLTIDDIDYLINIGYNFDNIPDSMFFLIWSCMLSSWNIKSFEIKSFSDQMKKTYRNFVEFALQTKTYHEIISYIQRDFWFIYQNDGRFDDKILSEEFDNYLCFFLEYINDTMCLNILDMPEFQKIVPGLFHDRMNKTIKYLLDIGMTTNHLSFVKISKPEVINDFREIKQNMIVNNIDENIIFELERSYLADK